MRKTDSPGRLDLFWLEILGHPNLQDAQKEADWTNLTNFSIAIILGDYDADMSTAMEIMDGGEGGYTVIVTDLTGSYSPQLGFTITPESRSTLARKVSSVGELYCYWPYFFHLLEWELWKAVKTFERKNRGKGGTHENMNIVPV